MNATSLQFTESNVTLGQWEHSALKGRVSIAHGFAFKSQYFSSAGDYRLMTPGHFYEEGGFRDLGNKQKYYLGPIPEGYVFDSGDMVVAMTEQADGLLGSAALVPNDGRYLHNQRLGRIRLLSDSIDLRFLYYVFNSPAYRRSVQETAAGTKVKHTSPAKLLEIAVPLPRLREQRCIAAVLSDVDELIQTLDRLIAKKRAIKLATMQQLLTGKTRLPGFERKWEMTPLGSIAHIQRGASPRPINSPIWFDERSPVGWVRISDVPASGMYLRTTTQRLSELGVMNSRPVSSGSLLMSICATVGRPVITAIDACIHDGFVVFDNLKVETRFMYFVLKTIEGEWSQFGQTGSQMNLNTDLIKRTEVLVPDDPNEQASIATVLSDMDAEIEALERRCEKMKQIKQGMMQQLLTGRVRLVGPEGAT